MRRRPTARPPTASNLDDTLVAPDVEVARRARRGVRAKVADTGRARRRRAAGGKARAGRRGPRVQADRLQATTRAAVERARSEATIRLAVRRDRNALLGHRRAGGRLLVNAALRGVAGASTARAVAAAPRYAASTRRCARRAAASRCAASTRRCARRAAASRCAAATRRRARRAAARARCRTAAARRRARRSTARSGVSGRTAAARCRARRSTARSGVSGRTAAARCRARRAAAGAARRRARGAPGRAVGAAVHRRAAAAADARRKQQETPGPATSRCPSHASCHEPPDIHVAFAAKNFEGNRARRGLPQDLRSPKQGTGRRHGLRHREAGPHTAPDLELSAETVIIAKGGFHGRDRNGHQQLPDRVRPG